VVHIVRGGDSDHCGSHGTSARVTGAVSEKIGVVYTSTKAVAQAVAQQIWTINGRFELFSSLLTNSNDL
jgi:hypothetical protein